MATLALAAVGSAIGAWALPAGIGALGVAISGAAIGQAVGATVGGMIDQRLFGPKAPNTEGPRLESMTFSNVAEGSPVSRIYGTVRPTCPLIWATRFREVAKKEKGGKGGMMGGGGSYTSYTYFCSFAVAVGERADEILRLFFDGQTIGDLAVTPHAHGYVIEANDGDIRATFYDGTQTEPDPLILSVEGKAPAYHGVAYVVFEELLLTDSGNRVPMVSAEAKRRLDAMTLRSLLQRVADDYGAPVDLSAVPAREVWGLKIDRPMSPRAAMEAVMELYQLVGSFTDDGAFRVTPMQGAAALTLDEEDLVEAESGGSPLTIKRARPDDAAHEIRLSYPDVDRDQQPAEAIARRRVRQVEGATTVQTAMPMTRAHATSLAAEALETSARGRETASGVFAPAQARILRPGDFVTIRSASGREHTIRLTSLAGEGRGPFEGVVTAMTPPRARVIGESPRAPDVVRRYGPVDLEFLDLPLLRGDEEPHAPHVAAWAEPWAGAAVYRAAPGGEYSLAALIEERATMGVLEAPLAPGSPSLWQGGEGLLVRLLPGGVLSAATEAAVYGGANAAAIRTPSGEWEILQFSGAVLISPGLWRLTSLLRGRRGTEHLAAAPIPSGARFVLLDSALVQADLSPTLRGAPQNWLWGPANKGRDHASYQSAALAFEGVGLRPYAPARLEAMPDGAGGLLLTWSRRSRADPDSWDGAAEPPLNEEREAYRLEIRSGGLLRRAETLTASSFAYSAAARAADGVSGPVEIAVAQISATFGPGVYSRITYG